MLTAAGRPMSVLETNDLIMAYEKHVAHNQKILEHETALEKALEEEAKKPVYHIIESKDY